MARSSRFRTRRGRPAAPRPEIDTGTPELAVKRAQHLTTEWIDLLRQENAISQDMHRCAMRFRWLYTLRFGCPGVRALDLTGGSSLRETLSHDETWKNRQEEEYRLAVANLRENGTLDTIMQLVVLNQIPTYSREKWLILLRKGLRNLAKLWR